MTTTTPGTGKTPAKRAAKRALGKWRSWETTEGAIRAPHRNIRHLRMLLKRIMLIKRFKPITARNVAARFRAVNAADTYGLSTWAAQGIVAVESIEHYHAGGTSDGDDSSAGLLGTA